MSATLPQPNVPRGAESPRRRRFGFAPRVLLGCALVILAGAVCGGLFVRGQVSNLASALSQNGSVKIGNGALAPAGYGDPETILLVGNDQRAHTTTNPVLPHANEMLLVRFDPSKPFISMMSIPRELQVTIDAPGGPIVTRLNAALFEGGIPLLVKTIHQVTGLAINHVVVIDFDEFQKAIDEMGCVYSTVDRPYYHLNVPGGEQYFQINLEPGYQQMCGSQALQFVAYRHGDTSLIRDARDQDFLLNLKQEFGPELIDNISKFEKIFGQTVTTDKSLHSTSGLLTLLGSLISSVSDPVRQVQFKVNLTANGTNACNCDTATPQQIESSVHSFLYGSTAVPKKGTANLAKTLSHAKSPPPSVHVTAIPASEIASARHVAATANLGFPLEYPRMRDADATGSAVDTGGCVALNNVDVYPLSCMRTYTIHGPDGKNYPAYVVVTSNGQLGQYYDIQGTTWTNAPLFQNPTQEIHLHGRAYALYYQGAHLETVAWFEHGAVYWVHNTLLDSISNTEMLTLAEHTLPVDSTSSNPNPGGGSSKLPASVTPQATSRTGVSSVIHDVGTIGGLLALIALPGFLLLVLRRWRQNASLRARLSDLSLRESMLAVRAGSAGLAGAVRPVTAFVGAGGQRTTGVTGAPAAVYGGGRRRPVALWVGIAVICVVVVIGAGLLVSGALGSGPARVVHRPPTVPVEVLNATSSTGAARALASELRGRDVRIAGVGNLVAKLKRGNYVLYARGERAQAARLADLLHGRTFKPEPISSTGSTLAAGAKLAVVIG